MSMDCIILAGGKGSRMEDSLPKALVEVAGKPILSHQLDYLSNKVDKIVFSLGYKHEDIVKYINQKHIEEFEKPSGISQTPHKSALNIDSKEGYSKPSKTSQIDFSVENEPLGTAGGLKLALQKTNSDLVLALNCDDITDINIAELARRNHNTICVSHPVLPFGLVKVYCGYAEFVEKPTLNDWVSCGWYLIKKDIINQLPDKGSLEYDVFPKIKLRVYQHEGFWKALNTKKDVEEFKH